ncbi:hypothetical protein HPP92_022682 [Vanilla planifolia]|uniref:Transcriptional regulatory protein n=1 Tax=Vanilla planifolia TaxID=51239 RepID=A0A835PXV5_VANPL|nr:hypothetical protein HPP92_022975 [Vanilla planifolia]KAG0459554.1 hypothetical protein HPP92_022682 [Vanilla planifolia]
MRVKSIGNGKDSSRSNDDAVGSDSESTKFSRAHVIQHEDTLRYREHLFLWDEIMVSTARALGSILHKVCNGSYLYSFSSLHRSYILRSSVPRISTSAWSFEVAQGQSQRPRAIWTTPVCMGRRSCKIAGRKDAQNLKKMKRNSKIGKEIVSAIKKGGPNPSSNTVLAAVLEKARELDVPKEIVERNIKRASDKSQEAFIEKFYEVYGFGGVGMVVEVLTDKITRSVANVRGVVKECGAKLADPGSILFKFRRVRVVNVKVNDGDKDQILSIALDVGAEDVIDPNIDSNDDDEGDDYSEDHGKSCYKIVASAENYSELLSRLREAGISFEPDNGFELLPLNSIEVDDEARDLNRELLSKLLQLDDVDAIYTDQK